MGCSFGIQVLIFGSHDSLIQTFFTYANIQRACPGRVFENLVQRTQRPGKCPKFQRTPVALDLLPSSKFQRPSVCSSVKFYRAPLDRFFIRIPNVAVKLIERYVGFICYVSGETSWLCQFLTKPLFWQPFRALYHLKPTQCVPRIPVRSEIHRFARRGKVVNCEL